MFKKVIVGIDFTPKTDRAVGAAVNLAKAFNGTTVLLHVVPASADNTKGTTGSATEVTRTIEQRLRDEAARLSAQTGSTVDWGVCEGAAAEEMVKYIQRWGGDLIVVGTEGRTGLGRILIGSVAERLVQTAPVPVLVVGPNAH